MKVLGLFKDMPRESFETRRALEQADQAPRSTLFETEAGVETLDRNMLRQAPALRRAVYGLLPVQVAQVLEALFLRRRYDAVLSWGEELAFPYALLCKIFGDGGTSHVAMCSWPTRSLKGVLLRFVHSHIDKLILWSSVQRRIAVEELHVPSSKIAFTKYFVDQQFFRPLQREATMICATGSEMRDYETLVKAMRGLDIPCHIASGAPHQTHHWLDNDLPPNVTVGAKNPIELRELYARSRFVIIPLFPSDTDNGITCILEAMAMGKTVICSRIEGQVDVIVEGETGLFVTVGDPTALRSAIQSLWNDPERAARMGRKGRAYVEECQTMDKFVSDVRSIVEEAISFRGSSELASEGSHTREPRLSLAPRRVSIERDAERAH
jgi:glycosyltransferase involved in cell wall biosynthesis